MIADRCQGAAQEGCMQIRQSTKYKCQRRTRDKERTERGYSTEETHGHRRQEEKRQEIDQKE